MMFALNSAILATVVTPIILQKALSLGRHVIPFNMKGAVKAVYIRSPEIELAYPMKQRRETRTVIMTIQ